MPRKPIKFNLDFMKKDIFSKFSVKQFDDATFTITPFMNNEPYNTLNMTAKIYIGVNNEMFMQDTNITVSSNSINVILDKNMLSNYGRTYAEIELTDSNGTVTSTSFIFDIDIKIGEGATIPGSIDGFVAKYEKLISEFKTQINNTVNDANINVNNKIYDIETRFQTLTSEQQQDAEVIDARKGEISLRKKIDKIDEQFNTIEINKANESSFTNLKNQIDGLVVGSGTSSAEVVQARVLNEFTYPTLQSSISSILDLINTNSCKCFYNCSIGNLVNGLEVEGNTTLRSGFVINDTTRPEYFRVSPGFGYKYKVIYYNSAKVMVLEEQWRDFNAEIAREYPYYRVVISRTDESEIALKEYINVWTVRNFDNLINTNKTLTNLLTSYNNNKIKTVKDYGAKGNGIDDDAQAIQNAINDCKEGEVLLFPFGTYMISKTITINKSIKIDMCGSTLACMYDVGAMIDIYSLDNTLIRDLKITNGTIDLKRLSWRGIKISDCARFTLSELTINEFKRDGILIHRGGPTNQCYEGFIENIKLFGCMELADKNTVGIYVDTSDCTFNNIIGTRGMNSLIVNGYGGNFYSKLHAWNDYPTDFRCLIKTYKECFVDHSFSDCLTTGIYVTSADGFAKVNQCEFLFPSKNDNNQEYYAISFNETVANPADSVLNQCYLTGYSSAKQEYNFDTNKDIPILNTTYKWANKKFNQV